MVGILKDMSESKAGAGAKVKVVDVHQGGVAAKGAGMGPAAADVTAKALDSTKQAGSEQAAGGQGGAAAGTVQSAAGATGGQLGVGHEGGGGAGASQPQVQGQADAKSGGSVAAATAHGTVAGEDEAAVIGPVVVVDEKGQLHQKVCV